MYVRIASILICLIYVSLRSTHAYEDEKIEHALRLLEQMTETRRGLSTLRNVLDGIDRDLHEAQKRTCSVGGGMSHHCAAALLDSQLAVQDWLKSGLSPGKRALSSASERSANSDMGRSSIERFRKRRFV